MQCCCLSRDSRARASMKTAERGERDSLQALALVKAVSVLRLKEIIHDVLSDNE